jgi:signal transduction histidine kinase
LEVLQNLLENAIKFMGDQPTPEIHIGSMKGEHGETVFFVKDNGIGIEQQYQNRIFGLFNKLNANTEGTGIGLTLVKRIIEVHNGAIWLESQPGKGTVFYFTLPGFEKQ